MLCLKLFSIIVVIFCFVSDQAQAFDYIHYMSLPRDYRTVFTTDGSKCYLFRDIYYMKEMNKKRSLAGQNALTFTTRTYCRYLCPTECDTSYNPVCGEYGDVYLTFLNDCELGRKSCINGQAFVKVPDWKCLQRRNPYKPLP